MKNKKDDFEELRKMKSIVDDENYNDEEDEDELPQNQIREAITFVGEDPTTKVYLLLLTLYEETIDDDGEYDDLSIVKEWYTIIGRQKTYDSLKVLIENHGIDVHRSFVLSGETAPEKAISVYRFMKICLESNKVRDRSGFDIDDGNDPVLPSDDSTILD